VATSEAESRRRRPSSDEFRAVDKGASVDARQHVLASTPEPTPAQLITDAEAEAENTDSDQRLNNDGEHSGDDRCASDPRSRLADSVRTTRDPLAERDAEDETDETRNYRKHDL
jgi:hypothetical protein